VISCTRPRHRPATVCMRGGRLPWSGRGSGRVQTGCCHRRCFSEQELARVGVSEATYKHAHHAHHAGCVRASPPSPLASPLPANIPDLNANLFWRLREYVNKVSLNKLVSVGSPTVACEQRREQHPGRCSRSSRARTTCSAGLSRVVGRRARSFQWPFRVTLSRQGTTGHCLLTRKSGRDEPERCCLLTEHSRGGECLESVLVKQRREFCRMCNERLSN
jgi:hypothetical protein